MNARFSEIKNLNLLASDGPIGEVVDLLIDDDHWMVRYLVVSVAAATNTQSKLVLISPAAISNADLEEGVITTQLNSQRVMFSPSLDDAQSISRQHELALVEHYGWPAYWLGQTFLRPQTLDRLAGDAGSAEEENEDSNLRSADELCGYLICSRSGRAGVMNDLVINLRNWRVDNGVANSSTWLPRESSMFRTSHIETIDWSTREITVDLSREALLPAANQFLSSMTQQASYLAGQVGQAATAK